MGATTAHEFLILHDQVVMSLNKKPALYSWFFVLVVHLVTKTYSLSLLSLFNLSKRVEMNPCRIAKKPYRAMN